MSIDEELRRFHEAQAAKRKEHAQKVAQHNEQGRAEMPQEEKAQAAWEKLKTETDVQAEMKQATAEQKANWERQENDPKHAHGNAYTAHEKNQAEADRMDLKNLKTPPMSEEQRDAVMAAITKDVSNLSQARQQAEEQQRIQQQQQQQQQQRR